MLSFTFLTDSYLPLKTTTEVKCWDCNMLCDISTQIKKTHFNKLKLIIFFSFWFCHPVFLSVWQPFRGLLVFHVPCVEATVSSLQFSDDWHHSLPSELSFLSNIGCLNESWQISLTIVTVFHCQHAKLGLGLAKSWGKQNSCYLPTNKVTQHSLCCPPDDGGKSALETEPF